MLKRFLMGVLLSTLAGGAAAFVITFLYAFAFGSEKERTLVGAAQTAVFLAFYALFICFAYAVVVGAITWMCVRFFGLKPTAWLAVAVSILLGAIPFSLLMLAGRALSGENAIFPAVAVAASLATGWTFWRVAFSAPAQSRLRHS